jgi:hypothetical protein
MTSTQTTQDVLAEPIDKLEFSLAAESRGRERDWAQEVNNALGGLEGALGLHTAFAETPDGLFTKANLTRPTSVRRVSELRQEHRDIQAVTQSLRAHIQTVQQAFQTPDASVAKVDILPEPIPLAPVPDFGAIRRSLAQLLTSLQRHQREEIKLLLESVNTDIGVGD